MQPDLIAAFSRAERPSALRNHLPNWHRLYKILSAKTFTSQPAIDLLDMTHRQLNDWDNERSLGSQRESAAGWRKFSALDITSLGVFKEIRKHQLPLSAALGHLPKMVQLGDLLWKGFPYIVDGRQVCISSNLMNSISEPYVADEDKVDAAGNPYQYFQIRMDSESSLGLIIRLNNVFNTILPKLDFENLKVNVDGKGRYHFEIPGEGKLALERSLPRK